MKYVNGVALSAPNTSSANSIQIDSSQLISISFHVISQDSTVNGSVKIQASNDLYDAGYLPANFTVTNWVDIPNQSQNIVSGSPLLFTLPQLSYRWLRAVYTRTSGGSSTITINFFGVSV